MFSALLLLAACGSSGADGSASDGATAPAAARTRTLTIAAYTTPREAYGTAILPAFAKEWKARTGEDVTFEESYQGSGAQARAVKEGFEADVVALSLDPDVKVIEDAGLITHDWRAGAQGGIVTRSIAVIAVRPGNPKNIADWTDLARPDVDVLTPNVRTSGGAMWNVLAIWGAGLRGHAGVAAGDEAGATGLLRGVLGRVSVMDKGARESIVNFEKGVGDAAITYENEVLVAKKEGKQMDYVAPPSTILIENPVAVVDAYAKKHGNEELAAAFVAFLHTPESQRAFAEYGLRPVDPALAPAGLPQPADLFTVADLGGWDAVKPKVFEKGGAYDQAATAPR
ncbi:MAG: sulfate ABC transporter substrate-binding protein [Pseudomonadota bacterium]|nr:sulfate ABC transporter substrate-binding protein [Pseudomonadota bacterium]